MSGGNHYDDGKVRLDLIPVGAIYALGDVLTYGSTKYGDRNWEKGIKYSRLFASTLRHLFKWWAGEDLDKESGLPHLAHALTNIAMLICTPPISYDTGDALDDRTPQPISSRYIP